MSDSAENPKAGCHPPYGFFGSVYSRARKLRRPEPMKKRLPILLGVLLVTGACAQATGFSRASLVDNGNSLMIYRSSGSGALAPKFPDQSGFDDPEISSDHRYIGWLVMQSGLGASYSQPTGLVVEGVHGHTHQFAGSYGMVYGWCFAAISNAVTFTYSLPHGRTPQSFDMRDIRSGRVLQHFELTAAQLDHVVGDAAPRELPQWARCAWINVRSHT